MKKTMLCLFIVFLTTGMLFAGGQSESKASQPVIEIASNATEENQCLISEKMYQDIVNEYNKEFGTNYKLKFISAQGMDIINTRMSSKDKPDIFQLDSPADVQRYAKDGLLLDITTYANKYDWQNKLFSWAYNLSQVNGNVVTLPMGYEGIVIWYDKDVMKDLGLDPAKITDLASFEAALDKAQKAGYIPIMLGSQDWPWAQEWYLSVMYSYTGRDLLKNTLNGKNSWTDPQFKQTVELYKSWNDKKYLANGKSYILTSDDAINAFTTNKCLFKLEGTWAPYWITPLSEEEQNNIGVMLHPAINANEEAHLPLAVGGMWCISADTQHGDIAAYILDKMLSQEYQGMFLENGMDVAPVAVDKEQFENLPPILKTMWAMVNSALDEGDFGYTTYAFYPPETRLYAYEGIVDVMEGNTSVDAYLKKLDELNKKELANGFTPVLP